jgi:hypothetical protein
MMQKLSMGIAVLITFVSVSCTPLEGATTIGPAGGYVFYDKGSYSDGWRYLEAAPKDAGKAEWGPTTTTAIVGGTSKGIGSGKHNTELIVAKMVTLGKSSTAAQLCDSFEYGSKDDWFLPSANELEEMLAVIKYEVRYGDGQFWSSSEDSVWRKEDNRRVRPIRQF